MVLMQKSLLTTIYNKWAAGVPTLLLMRQYNLSDSITAPTLTKLLQYTKVLTLTDSEEVKKVVRASLFPAWLTTQVKLTGNPVNKQPKEMAYLGKMPLGHWEVRATIQN
jgi:hypothetical protein